MNLRTASIFCLLSIGISHGAELFDETKVTTLFAFDQVSIPYTQNVRLEMRTPERHPANPVVPRGAPGTPDAMGVQFYGSILRENGKYRLWYVAYDDDQSNRVASARWRPAYAESEDGIKWTKPVLGLVKYGGNKHNNLVAIDPALGFVNLKVIKDPDDPNLERRYKMSAHVYFRHNTRLGTLAPYASPDGLTWKLLTEAKPLKAELQEKDLVLPAVHFEPCGGLYRWDGMFYISGQNAMNAPRPYHGRVTRLYRSADFVNWSQTSSISFVREPQHTILGPGHSLEAEQCHEGFSVWNRGNVLLGIYGQWHGAKEWKDITIDLGFVVSNDGLNFREPAHEWTFLRRGEDGAWDQGGVIQGQGFENIGHQTFIYYGSWDPRHSKDSPARGGVGIATLPRDRFGDLVVEEVGKGKGDYQLPVIQSEFITAALILPPQARIYLNADGLSEASALKLELLDEHERPLAGFAGADAAVITQGGFQTPVVWKGQPVVSGFPGRVHIKGTFVGDQNTKARFSALYIAP